MGRKGKKPVKPPPMIPNDVIFEILSWARASSVLRFRWICKYWFNLTTGPDFLKIHLLHHSTSTAHQYDYYQTINKTSLLLQYSRDPQVLYSMRCMDVFNQSLGKIKLDFYNLVPTLSVVDDDDDISNDDRLYRSWDSKVQKNFWTSCNGLFYFYNSHAYFLWNPCMRELKKLPKLATPDYTRYCTGFRVHGFGYDHVIDDYKVIRLVYYQSVNGFDNNNLYNSRVTSVYTLGSNSWSTKCESIPLITKDVDIVYIDIVYSIRRNRSLGFLFNGALHWTMRSPVQDGHLVKIMYFDIGKDEHGEIQLPADDYIAGKKHSLSMGDLDLCVLNGCLCISQFRNRMKIDVWMMKDYVVKDSWTKLFTINMRQVLNDIFDPWPMCLNDLKFLKYHRDGEICMVFNGKYYVVMDAPTKMKKKNLVRYVHKIEEDDDQFIKATYIETLVSLNSGMYMRVGASRTTPLHKVMEDQKHKVDEEKKIKSSRIRMNTRRIDIW